MNYKKFTKISNFAISSKNRKRPETSQHQKKQKFGIKTSLDRILQDEKFSQYSRNVNPRQMISIFPVLENNLNHANSLKLKLLNYQVFLSKRGIFLPN